MNHREARAHLVREGAQILRAAKLEADARAQLEPHREALEDIPMTEQRDCFLESCYLMHIDPDDPAIANWRGAFEVAAREGDEARLLSQLPYAEMN